MASRFRLSLLLSLLVSLQQKPHLEGHAAPGGPDVSARLPHHQRLEDQWRGPQRYCRGATVHVLLPYGGLGF